jgi:hypothetical protein
MFGKKTSKQLKRELTGKTIILQKRSIVFHQLHENTQPTPEPTPELTPEQKTETVKTIKIKPLKSQEFNVIPLASRDTKKIIRKK